MFAVLLETADNAGRLGRIAKAVPAICPPRVHVIQFERQGLNLLGSRAIANLIGNHFGTCDTGKAITLLHAIAATSDDIGNQIASVADGDRAACFNRTDLLFHRQLTPSPCDASRRIFWVPFGILFGIRFADRHSALGFGLSIYAGLHL